MKALSIWQPWAQLVAIGAKRIETRHWSTRHSGWIAVHAAKRWTREERDIVTYDPFAEALQRGGYDPRDRELPLGAVVAVAQLIDCVTTDAVLRAVDAGIDLLPDELEFGNYEPGRFGWVLKDVTAIESVPCRGQQGLYDLDADTYSAVRAAFGRARKAVPA